MGPQHAALKSTTVVNWMENKILLVKIMQTHKICLSPLSDAAKMDSDKMDSDQIDSDMFLGGDDHTSIILDHDLPAPMEGVPSPWRQSGTTHFQYSGTNRTGWV